MEWRLKYKIHGATSGFLSRVHKAAQCVMRVNDIGRVLVSTSWGKDSVAMMHLVYSLLGAMDLFYMESMYMPGYESVKAYFLGLPNVRYYVIRPRGSEEDILKSYREIGLAHERRSAVQKRYVSEIKKTPAAKFVLNHNYDVCILGMRSDENKKTRGRLMNYRGLVYKTRYGFYSANPIGRWSSKDVWAYIVNNDVPYNRRIYDAETHGFTRETIRNTTWASTDGAHRGRLAWLKAHFPEEYNKLSTQFNNIRNFS